MPNHFQFFGCLLTRCDLLACTTVPQPTTLPHTPNNPKKDADKKAAKAALASITTRQRLDSWTVSTVKWPSVQQSNGSVREWRPAVGNLQRCVLFVCLFVYLILKLMWLSEAWHWLGPIISKSFFWRSRSLNIKLYSVLTLTTALEDTLYLYLVALNTCFYTPDVF